MNNWLDLLRGLYFRIRAVIKHVPITVDYPFVLKPIPVIARTRLKNHFPECTGCLDCAKVCPTKAIEIQGIEYSSLSRPMTPSGSPIYRTIDSYAIDYSVCVSCGLCVAVCPTQCLSHDKSPPASQSQVRDLRIDLVHVPRTMRRGETS
ncbi:MAG: 4Fe-4S dicluster domain-containing protein [Bdellovibrionales bacterium]|nr:4Fe-4S dicluster domain-containing protein [Bdellovibrionales bacterium]